MTKSVLVTGGLGFIGSHLANHLASRGYDVSVTDLKHLRSCFLGFHNVKYFNHLCDLVSFDNCLRVTKGMDEVYALAANMGGIGFISKVGAEVMRDNALINANILEACVINRVKKIFFTSSACVYPEYKQYNLSYTYGLREDDAFPAQPDSFYGWEKVFTEKMMEAYAVDHGLQVRIARFHNVYGPHGTFEGGREKAPAALCRKVAETEDGGEIVVWGDGRQQRSFLYIDDCVKGIEAIMDSDYSRPLNIGSDKIVSIDKLAEIIFKISGKNLAIEHDLDEAVGVRSRNADLQLVRKVVGWHPETSLEEGLSRTYRWIESKILERKEALAWVKG